MGVWISHSGLNLMPKNKRELISCILSRVCESRKPKLRTHVVELMILKYSCMCIQSGLHSLERSMLHEWDVCLLISKNRCIFIHLLFYSYVLLKRSPETPLFDERFVNYGYNKVQLIEHLRSLGYHFYILTQAFAMDVPHEEWSCEWCLMTSSEFRKDYLIALHNKDLPMQEVYSKFQKELNVNYSSILNFPICKEVTTPYYLIEKDYPLCFHKIETYFGIYSIFHTSQFLAETSLLPRLQLETLLEFGIWKPNSRKHVRWLPW